ncbi:ATP-binding cassette domain-containing protein [Nocardia sp. R6R-6]|uniref:ATP-binding cassette domain-containing protein n=1 Tax=Nocardia sp. R6R-6 TaxID=3459303 RepID=UPI00403E0BC9
MSDTTMVHTAAAQPALSIRGVSKAYGNTQALDNASLEARRGSIHALMGGNGSGKSTLIKILAGVVPADAGTLGFAGSTADLTSHTAMNAKAMGLRFVHQENSTFPDLTVAENLAVGHGFELGRLGNIKWSALRRRAADVLARFDIAVQPDARLGTLSGATQMMVAIARALQDQGQSRGKVLVLDEPTASLPTHEVDLLLGALRKYAANGHTILYVTHRLQEVLSCADEGTVFRDGRVAGTFDPSHATHDDLVTLIAGKPLERAIPGARQKKHVADDNRRVVLRAQGLGHGEGNFELRSGEVVAIAGILGSGRTRLLRQIFGSLPRAGATVEVDGRMVTGRGPGGAMAKGIALVPENRHVEAAFPDLSISDNLSIAALATHTRGWWVSRRSERSAARTLISDFFVKTASETAPLSALSGGNQQKVILARWLQRKPKVLLLDEPTQGVDVGARAEIHALIRSAADAGAAVLLVSSDFDELAAAADRVLVLHEGRIVAEIDETPIRESTINDVVYLQEGR